MRSVEKKLFDFIKDKLPKNVSFIEEISDVLDISYDAAYRRVKKKTSLTLKEGLQLANHFNYNLNELLLNQETQTEKILVEKSHTIISDDFLNRFFDRSIEETQNVLNSKKGRIINCVKDFPFYHTDNGFLKRFRLFLFINMLSKDVKLKKIRFSEFRPSKEISEKYDIFLNQYRKVSLIEIWNDTTIDNVLNQIQYFYEVGLTTNQEAVSITNGLLGALKELEQQIENEKRGESNNKFHFYHNNLISLLNTVFMKTDTDSKIFVPYTNLTYFKVTDRNTTNQIEEHLKTQLEFSNKLSGNASVDRKKFFNYMYQKIENRKLKLSLTV